MATAPNTLFAFDPDCATGLQPVKPRKRGRGACPRREFRVRFDKRNPTGSHALGFRYRVLKAWDADQLKLVESCLVHYFTTIGGFRLAKDALVRTCYEAFDDLRDEAAERGGTVETLMKWAIDTFALYLKGDSPEERGERVKYRGSVDTFFYHRYEKWLHDSPRYVTLVEDQARDEQREHQAAQRRRLDNLPRNRQSSAVDPQPAEPRTLTIDCTTATPRVVDAPSNPRRAAFERQLQEAVASREFNDRVWSVLSETRRKELRNRVWSDFSDYVTGNDTDPHDIRLDPLWREWAVREALRRFPDVWEVIE